jgi:hypothetical protein
MPIPQVNDRIKEAPAVMLRAVFAGVGQLLLAADRVRSGAAGTSWPADRTAPKGRARAQSRWHTLDDTGSGTATLARERADSYGHSAARPSASTTTSPAPATAARPARAAPAAGKTTAPAPAEQAAQPEAAVQAMPAEQPTSPAKTAIGGEPTGADELAVQAAPTADAPPLPGYDDLSLPSLRARMRVLDAAALRTLLAYEKAHAHRDDVIAMFERRLAKITAG